MGAKITKLEPKRSNKTPIPIYDIDDVDGTYYESIDRPSPQGFPHVNDVPNNQARASTISSIDSAFSDTSRLSSNSIIDQSQPKDGSSCSDKESLNTAGYVTFPGNSLPRKTTTQGRLNQPNTCQWVDNSDTDPYRSADGNVCNRWQRTKDYASDYLSLSPIHDDKEIYKDKGLSGVRRHSRPRIPIKPCTRRTLKSAKDVKTCPPSTTPDSCYSVYKSTYKTSTKAPLKLTTCVSATHNKGRAASSTDTCEYSTERLVFLIEAFQPLIEKCLNVLHVIPHLIFIEETEVFREKHRQSPQEAVSYLIQRIKESGEPGKWQTFLEALRSAGYPFISSLLLETTEEDHTINRQILRLFTPELVSRIEPEQFIDHLLAEDVITDQDREEIQCEKNNRGNSAASLMLLERVPKRHEDWFGIFVRVLENCGLTDLKDQFNVPEICTSNCSTRVYPETDENEYTGYITPTYKNVSPMTTQQSRDTPLTEDDKRTKINKLNAKRDALLAQITEQKEINNLNAEIRTLQGEFEQLIQVDQKQTTNPQTPHDTLTADHPQEINNPLSDTNQASHRLTNDYVLPPQDLETDSLQNDDQDNIRNPVVTNRHLTDQNIAVSMAQENNGPNNDDGEAGYNKRDDVPMKPTVEDSDSEGNDSPNASNSQWNLDKDSEKIPQGMIEEKLDKLANGVSTIVELLVDIKHGLIAKDTLKTTSPYYRSSSSAVSDTYLAMPVQCKKVPSVGQYGYSMDSAISMGYITRNTEQYV